MSSQSSTSWDVEEILDRKYIENKPHYLLKWKNFPHSENTWEPVGHLGNCAELLRVFEAQRSVQLEAYKAKHAAEMGFNRGLEPEFVVGVTDVRRKILYGVKWVDTADADIIESEEVMERCPHLILEFYLENIGYRQRSHAPGNDSLDHQSSAEKNVRLNGSHNIEEPLECTALHVLQYRLDNGFTIDTVKSSFQDPNTKDLIYHVHWSSDTNNFKLHGVPDDDYVPADFAHRYFQREVIKYFEDNFYYKEKYPTNMIADVYPPND